MNKQTNEHCNYTFFKANAVTTVNDKHNYAHRCATAIIVCRVANYLSRLMIIRNPQHSSGSSRIIILLFHPPRHLTQKQLRCIAK